MKLINWNWELHENYRLSLFLNTKAMYWEPRDVFPLPLSDILWMKIKLFLLTKRVLSFKVLWPLGYPAMICIQSSHRIFIFFPFLNFPTSFWCNALTSILKIFIKLYKICFVRLGNSSCQKNTKVDGKPQVSTLSPSLFS